MNRPKQAPKRSPRSLSQKFKTARLVAAYGKTMEEAAMIEKITVRIARREVDYIKNVFGVRTIQELTHAFHAHDMGFCNEDTKRDYLRIEREWRETA
jgi:Cu/Zn superoxide dismutase